MMLRLAPLLLLAALTAALTLQPSASHAQEPNTTARSARPKPVHDDVLEYGADGHKVFLYLEEGKEVEDGTAYVFYSPVLFLVVEDDGTVKYKIKNTEDGIQVLLYVYPESETEALHAAIRKQLSNIAKEKTGIPPYGVPYRVQPLTLTQSWFESGTRRNGTPRFRSVDMTSTTLVEEMIHPVSFYVDSHENAVALVSGLAEDAPLNYRYVFAGVSDDVCTVEFSGERIRELGLLKDLEGEGRQGYVSRQQAATIADQIVSTENVRARCRDAEVSSWIADRLLGRVAQHAQMVDLHSWDDLKEFAGLDPDALKTDVETLVKNLEKEMSRDTEISASSATSSSTTSRATEVGISFGQGGSFLDIVSGFFGIGGSGSVSQAQASAWANAQKKITDVLNKKGIYGEWQGNRYLPKSVDVYSKAGLTSTWSQNMTETHSETRGEEGRNNFLLPPSARRLSPDAAARHVERLTRQIRRYVRNEVSGLEELVDRAIAEAEGAGNLARSAQIDADDALEILRTLLRD